MEILSYVDIFKKDAKKNHNDINYEEHIKNVLNKVQNEKWNVCRFGNTIILSKQKDNTETLEFHCYNADPGVKLAENVNNFFNKAKENGFKYCETPYSNPKINDLLKKITNEDNLVIEKNDNIYTATVRL